MTTQNISGTISSNPEGYVLDFLIREPIAFSQKKKAIILLHGVGSNEQDLFALTDQLPNDFYVISARGQFTLSSGRYAWYNVSFATGKPVFDAEQEASSRERISAFIGQLKHQYKFDEIYLGGFSQGAIMSYSIGLTQPMMLNGVFSLGGRILEEIKPSVENSKSLKELKVFIAHGVQDNTLPIHHARDAKKYLESLEVNMIYHEYNVGHQITPQILSDLNRWING